MVKSRKNWKMAKKFKIVNDGLNTVGTVTKKVVVNTAQ